MIHENKTYKIVYLEECEDPTYFHSTEFPMAQYAIMNKETNRTEAVASNMPQALLTATQFDRLLQTKYHYQIINNMFTDVPDANNVEVVQLFDSDDEGNVH